MFQSAITAEMHYDDWARHYDRDMTGWGYHAPARIISRLGDKLRGCAAAPRILDVGIGTGLLARKCRAIRPDSLITGVDVSQRMLDACRAAGDANALYRLDAARDPLPGGAAEYDFVLAAGLMENIPKIAPVLAEMARVTRPGGWLAFTFMPTAGHDLRERLAKKLRPGRTAEGRLVLGGLDLYRHNPAAINVMAGTFGLEAAPPESFVGYRTYVLMAVRYNIFIARRTGDPLVRLPLSPEHSRIFSPD